MDCPLRPRATDYVRRELGDREHERFTDHLESCWSCREEVADLESFIARLTDAEAAGSTEWPDVSARVLSRLPVRDPVRAPYSRQKARRWILLAGSAAACALAAVALLWGGGHSERNEALSSRQPPPTVPAGPAGALLAARDWLVSTQEPSGEWDPVRWGGAAEFRIALTGLATLALLGDDRPSAEKAALSAAESLVASQQESGHLGPPFRDSLYNHAIGCLALVELSRAHPPAGTTSSAARAIEVLVEAQDPRGAWGYSSSRDGLIENESISIWALRALVSWQSLGHAVDPHVLEAGFQWFERSFQNTSTPRYIGRGGHVCGDGSSPIAAFAVLLGTGTESRMARAAIDRLLRRAGSSFRASPCCYDQYFLSLAMKASETPALVRYGSRARRLLVESQVRTGPERGSWAPEDRWGGVGGRLYTTALAALTLTSQPEVRGSGNGSG